MQELKLTRIRWNSYKKTSTQVVAISTDPDSIGGIRYAARSSEANAATSGILLKFFTKGSSLVSPIAISFWLISTILSNFLLNSGFSTSSTAGKILAVVRFVCIKTPNFKKGFQLNSRSFSSLVERITQQPRECRESTENLGYDNHLRLEKNS